MNEGMHKGKWSRSMIGRERELAELGTALDEAIAGRGGLWLLTGEPGIGKSRLAEEIADLAECRGMAVHWGRCWESGGAPAYWPWIQVLRSVLADEDIHGFPSERSAAQLVQILPELNDRLSGAERPLQLEPEQALFALMDAVSGVLREAASSSAMVVLLEDLHVADPTSITLLDFVSRQLRAMPLLVVGNYRETEARQEGVGESLVKMTRGARTLRLGRLQIEDVAECVRQTTGIDPGPRVVAAIHEASEGNPLYAGEIAGLMQSRGELEEVGDRVDIAIPDSVKAVIRERVAALNAPTREILEAASVVGRGFRLADLAELIDTSPEDLDGPLEEAAAARIIDRAGADCHRFVHILIREVFLSTLPVDRRRALHLQRADALESYADRGRGVPWFEIAHHLLEAGPDTGGRALDACVRAAEQATAQLAFNDAAEMLAHALALADRAPDADPRLRCTLLLERAQALLKGGDVPSGRGICRKAARIARQLDDAELFARAALIYGSIFVYAVVDVTLIDLLHEALAMLDRGDSPTRARLLARLAAAMQPAVDPEEPMALAREAIAMARRTEERSTLLHTIRAGCSALMDLADPAERLALNREHVELAKELGEQFEALRGYLRMVIDALDLGKLDTADAAAGAYDRLASQTRLPHHLWPVASIHGLRAMMEGRFDEAEDLISEAHNQAERLQDPNAERTLALQRIGLARTREAFGEMRKLPDAARLELRPATFTDFFLRILTGSGLARMERLDKAPPGMVESLIDETVASHDRDRSILCPVAEVAAESGNLAAAEVLIKHLEPFAEHWVSWGLFGMVCEGPISRYLALLSSTLDRPEDAERYFRHALDSARCGQARPVAARIAYEFARHLARNDGPAERRAVLLCEAQETARDLGQEGLLELIEALGVPGERDEPSDSELVPAVAAFSLEREGEIWVCSCGEGAFKLKNTKGVRMLARLVAEPGREIHVLDLSDAAPTDQAVDGGDAGEILDATAKAQYQRRIEELKAEIEEAEGFNDPGRAARARDEIEIIAAELSKAFGLGGRQRRMGSAAERARVNVQRRLRDAVKRVSEQSPSAGKHLDWALKTGMYCVYEPS